MKGDQLKFFIANVAQRESLRNCSIDRNKYFYTDIRHKLSFYHVRRVYFITLGGYIFLGQMVSVGNYRGVFSSRDDINLCRA